MCGESERRELGAGEGVKDTPRLVTAQMTKGGKA